MFESVQNHTLLAFLHETTTANIENSEECIRKISSFGENEMKTVFLYRGPIASLAIMLNMHLVKCSEPVSVRLKIEI